MNGSTSPPVRLRVDRSDGSRRAAWSRRPGRRRGLTGPPGPAGPRGPKGETGDVGQTPIPQHYVVFTHPGFIHIPANAEQTATLDCPAARRVLSGGPTDDFVIAGAPVRPHTLMASVPNATGTGWVVTIKAGATAYDLERGDLHRR